MEDYVKVENLSDRCSHIILVEEALSKNTGRIQSFKEVAEHLKSWSGRAFQNGEGTKADVLREAADSILDHIKITTEPVSTKLADQIWKLYRMTDKEYEKLYPL